MTSVRKRRIELELDEAILDRAETAGIDLPNTLENALRERLDVREPIDWAAWNEENREAIQAMNDYVATHGLPLAKYRRF